LVLPHRTLGGGFTSIYKIMSQSNLIAEKTTKKTASQKEKASKTTAKLKKYPQSPEQLEVKLDFARVSQQVSDYVLFSPMHYEPGYAYPLLIWLHGPGNDERQIMKMMPLISMRNYVGIAPRGLARPVEAVSPPVFSELKNRRMEPTAVPELVRRLNQEQEKAKEKEKSLKEVYDWSQTEEGIAYAEQKVFDCLSIAEEKCHIAKNRVFLVGFDSGGTMAFRLAMQYPDYFSGVISLGGRFPEGNLPLRQWNTIRNLPTLLAIGKESSTYSPENARSDLRLFHTAGLSVCVRQYDCGQELSLEMLQDVNRWMMERICDKSEAP
jgi:phospholipase/carboxylesterase